ncbi:MAG: hypothetical protein QM769_00195 [Pseudoxanthomonas sp.]
MKRIWLLLLLCCMVPTFAEEITLSAEEIVRLAHAASGGQGWKRPQTLHLTGSAVSYGDGTAASRKQIAHYEMWRVFPAWNQAAHGANGKFRLDARNGDAVAFQISYDGKDTWDEKGKVEQAEASREWSENFGFGIIRFALDEGFKLTRMADDQVEGRAAWTIRVADPAGGNTLFWIDQMDHSVRKVGFATTRGWHERIYSDFYMVDSAQGGGRRFQQPGRVRLYYGGALVSDIRWTRAEVDAPIAHDVFVLGEK